MDPLKTKAQWIAALEAIDMDSTSSLTYGSMPPWLLHAFTHRSTAVSAETPVGASTLIDIVDSAIDGAIADEDVWCGVGTLRWLDGDQMAPWGHHLLAQLARDIGGERISQQLYAHLFVDYMAIETAMRRFVARVYPRAYADKQHTHELPKGGEVVITPLFAGRSHLTLKQRDVVIGMMGDSLDAEGSTMAQRIVVAPSLERTLKLIRVATESIEEL